MTIFLRHLHISIPLDIFSRISYFWCYLSSFFPLLEFHWKFRFIRCLPPLPSFLAMLRIMLFCSSLTWGNPTPFNDRDSGGDLMLAWDLGKADIYGCVSITIGLVEFVYRCYGRVVVDRWYGRAIMDLTVFFFSFWFSLLLLLLLMSFSCLLKL